MAMRLLVCVSFLLVTAMCPVGVGAQENPQPDPGERAPVKADADSFRDAAETGEEGTRLSRSSSALGWRAGLRIRFR